MKTFKDHLDSSKIKENIKNVISCKKILSNQKMLLIGSRNMPYRSNNYPYWKKWDNRWDNRSGG